MNRQKVEQAIKESLGIDDGEQPIVRFFDYALKDDELSEASGRPRYRAHTFIEKISRDPAVRDVFHRRIEEQDKQEWPRQWEAYQQAKTVIANRSPALKFMPGMDVAVFEELRELGLTDCEKLANYEGNINGLERFREMAKKIMEISNESRDLREERQTVHAEVQRPVHSQGSVPGGYTSPGYIAPGTATSTQAAQEESKEKGYQTFSYSFQA